MMTNIWHLKKYTVPFKKTKATLKSHLHKICGHHKISPSKQDKFNLKHFSL